MSSRQPRRWPLVVTPPARVVPEPCYPDGGIRSPVQKVVDELFFRFNEAVSKEVQQGIASRGSEPQRWAYLANCLFFEISRQYGQDFARHIFKTSGPPPKRLIQALRNTSVLERLHRMRPKPNVAKLARELAEENKELPQDRRRGVGSTDALTLEGHIRDLEKAHKKHVEKLEKQRRKLLFGL